MSYRIEIYKDDEPYGSPINIFDGDSFVFTAPSYFLSGKNAVLTWRLRQAERAIRNLHRMLDEAKEQTYCQICGSSLRNASIE